MRLPIGFFCLPALPGGAGVAFLRDENCRPEESR
jgi:hypothetical protein